MRNFGKTRGFRFCKILLSLVLLNQCCNCALAKYEVINAVTIGNEEMKQKTVTPDPISYNNPEDTDYSEQSSLTYLIDKKIKNIKRNRKAKTELDDEILEDEEINDSDLKTSKNSDYNEAKYTQEEVSDSNKYKINADKITYDDITSSLIADGNVEIIAKSQGVVLKADHAYLDKGNQNLKLTGNVKVTKESTEMVGESLIIDMNEQNILMDNPTMSAYSFNITAQEGFLISNDIQALNGSIAPDKKIKYVVSTSSFNQYYNVDRSIDTNWVDKLDDGKTSYDKKYRIDAKDIVLTSYKDHNSILLKKANIYYNNHKIVHKMDIEILSDKERQVIEPTMPEVGSLRGVGTYVGYGFAFRMPKGHLLKIIPAYTYEKKSGFGVIARYSSPNFKLFAGYSTGTQMPVVLGKYRFNKNTTFTFARCSYIDDGFYGTRRPGYAVQLADERTFINNDLGIAYNQMISGGFYSEYKEKQTEKNAFATTRFRYMATISKNLLSYKNEEQDTEIVFGASAQGAATLYGSGQTMGTIRIGPTLTSKVKNWESNIAYYLTGTHGDSPFWFDKYMYGDSTIMFNEKINFGDKLAIGYRAFVTPKRDNWENRLLTESAFYFIAGPQDLKLIVAYDFIRKNANINLMFILKSESTKINFEKLISKNMDESKGKRDFYKEAQKNKEDI